MGKYNFLKIKTLKGWHIVDPTQIINKTIKDDATYYILEKHL